MITINKILGVLSIVLITLFSVSCVNDDEFKTPDVSVKDPNISADKITTFKAIKSRYEQAVSNGNSTAAIRLDENELYIEGYVVSSDKAGNFFEELIIQNKIDDSDPDNDPRLGFKIEINVSSLNNTYEMGRKVFVKLNGLSVGESNGVLAIGKGEGDQIKQIQASEYQDFVIRGVDIVEITPKVAGVEELSENDENTFVQLNNMQINRFELSQTFAGEGIDEFDGFRTLESCDSGVSILLQTSTFADFKSVQLPQNKGTISGIFSRDFGDDFSVFIINSTSAINFDSNERCDPVELDCGLAESFGSTNLFYDDFESQTNNRLITGNGWTNYMEAGSEGWEAFSSISSNATLGRSARIRAASSGDTSNVAWLITPAINLDAQNNETLRFKTSNSFADNSYLELLYSLDWDGTEANINSANWGVLPAAYIVKDTDSFAPWFNSGNVDLSCATGTIHIAFKYTGSGLESFDGTYELDEVSIDFTP